MERREFLSLLKRVGLCIPFLPHNFLLAKEIEEKYFLLVELSGGNDGLNTVIPYKDELYYNLRPNLAIKEDEFFTLNQSLALNQNLKNFYNLWKEKSLCIALGVGYKNPNRSHFRSKDIWDTASHSNEHLKIGWLANFYEELKKNKKNLAQGLVLLGNPLPFKGSNFHSIILNSPKISNKEVNHINMFSESHTNPLMEKFKSIKQDLNNIQKYMKGNQDMSSSENKSKLGDALSIISHLIIKGVCPQAIKVRLGGFDTHKNQKETHQNLLKELDTQIGKFVDLMKKNNLWDKVVIMTYSEFGRRIKENFSEGTDHGTSAPQFILGGKVKGGFIGEQPSISSAKKYDLSYKLDYRHLYTSILNKWWNIHDLKHLKNFAPFNIFYT